MFEDDSLQLSILLIAVCLLYIFGSIAVGIISKKIMKGFLLGFVWSICFTPIIALFLVLKYDSSKNKNETAPKIN
jgi:preprotein translocase subunit SecF